MLLSLSVSMVKSLICFHFFSTGVFSWSWYNLVSIVNLAAHVKITTTSENKKIKYVLQERKKKKTPILFGTLICNCIYYFLKK